MPTVPDDLRKDGTEGTLRRGTGLVARAMRRILGILGVGAGGRQRAGGGAPGTGGARLERERLDRPEYLPPAANARPVVSVNGARFPQIDAGLLSVKVEETLNGHHLCEVTVANWGARSDGDGPGYLFTDRSVFDFGGTLQVAFGGTLQVAAAPAAPLFRGRIIAIEARFPGDTPPTLAVRAAGRGWELGSLPRTRTFEGVSDEDAFRAVAANHGMQAHVSVSGPTHDALSQVGRTDLAFLQERARALDAQLWFDEQGLQVHPRGQGPFPSLTLRFGGNLRKFTVLADLEDQRSSVTTGGWNEWDKEALSARCDDTVLAVEIEEGRSGARVLAETFGRRDESVSGVSPPAAAMSDEARARFAAGARRFVTGHGVADPAPRLRAGARLTLLGLGQMYDGAYEVTEVTHRFDLTDGQRTEFVVARPWLGE